MSVVLLLIDVSWWVSTKIYHSARWLIWGARESEEMKSIRITNQRMEEMEQRLEQIMAFQTQLATIDTTDPDLTKSLVILNDNNEDIIPTLGHSN